MASMARAGEVATAASLPDPSLSVVIPTHRRDAMLQRLLIALARQDLPAAQFEIVIVDDARSPTTAPLVAEVADRFPEVRMRLINGPCRGPAGARNAGWRAARGAIIAFIDDDAFPIDDHWLCEGMTSFADPAVAVVTGPVRVPVQEDSPTDFQRNVQRLEQAAFLTCNAFCRRSALEQVDGFDERFTVPYREDSDLQFRIEAAGGRLGRNDHAVVVHPAPPGPFAVSLRLQRYSMFNALIYRKHRGRYRAELEARPPLHYYATVALAVAALLAFVTGRRRPSLILCLGWAWLAGRFFLRRARGTSRQPRHLLDLGLTSVLIPPLSIYWRIRGALKYRVFFF
jgi:GT2 family glycosyltransferase